MKLIFFLNLRICFHLSPFLLSFISFLSLPSLLLCPFLSSFLWSPLSFPFLSPNSFPFFSSFLLYFALILSFLLSYVTLSFPFLLWPLSFIFPSSLISFLLSFLSFPLTTLFLFFPPHPPRVAHFIPDILPVVSGDPGRIGQMVTNSRLLLGVLAKVPELSGPEWIFNLYNTRMSAGGGRTL